MRVEIATSEAEVREVARLMWPYVEQGQVGFGLAGQGSLEALTEAWLGCLGTTDSVLIARQGSTVVGACGLFVVDAETAQVVNGPVAIRDHEAVYDALLATVAQLAPRAKLIVGVSHRHQYAMRWLDQRGERQDHLFPYRAEGRPGDTSYDMHRVTEAEQARFRELFDALVGRDLWWTSDRICERWDEWLCLVDPDWTGVLAARNYVGSRMSEVFAMGAGSVEVATSLVGAWMSEAVRGGRTDLVFFADSGMEREAAEVCGMACTDEYLSWEVPLATG